MAAEWQRWAEAIGHMVEMQDYAGVEDELRVMRERILLHEAITEQEVQFLRKLQESTKAP